jgi:hypothetical protein
VHSSLFVRPTRVIGAAIVWAVDATALCHERAANQKHQTVMIVTGSASDWGIFPAQDKSIPQEANLLSVEGAMIDALFNVAVFAMLGLCIVGFGAWAQKRVLGNVGAGEGVVHRENRPEVTPPRALPLVLSDF